VKLIIGFSDLLVLQSTTTLDLSLSI